MFGHDLAWWNTVMLSALGLGAIAAVVVVVATAIVIKLQDQEAADAKFALEQYKISAKRDADIAITQARADADVKINRTRDDANISIERLHQQNIILEKETSDAKLETERLKERLAWRVLSQDAIAKLKGALSGQLGRLNIYYPASDTEASYLAIQFANIIHDEKWELGMLSSGNAGSVIFGIIVPDSPSPSTAILRKALTAAGVGFSTNALPEEGMSGFGGIIPDAAVIFVGSKPPPQ